MPPQASRISSNAGALHQRDTGASDRPHRRRRGSNPKQAPTKPQHDAADDVVFNVVYNDAAYHDAAFHEAATMMQASAEAKSKTGAQNTFECSC